MKHFSRILLFGAVLAMLAIPHVSMSDQLAAPLETTVFPGQTTINYAGQALRFNTDVPLKVKLVILEPGRVRLTFGSHASGRGDGSSAPATTMQVYWENWDNDLYDGPPPGDEPWDGILLTESGFTEK